MSKEILEAKQQVVAEISEQLKASQSTVVVEYRGLTVAEVTELRRALRAENVGFKVYKNTLVQRAVEQEGMNELEEYLVGPNALAFGKDDAVAPARILADFAKDHEALILKIGYVDGEIADNKKLAEYATIPSRDGLLTMLAGGMIGLVRDLSICLNLYSEQKEEN